MKIYETKTAPTPRRVRFFLAEKDIPMEYVQVDIQGGENLSPAMRSRNPMAVSYTHLTLPTSDLV